MLKENSRDCNPWYAVKVEQVGQYRQGLCDVVFPFSFVSEPSKLLRNCIADPGLAGAWSVGLGNLCTCVESPSDRSVGAEQGESIVHDCKQDYLVLDITLDWDTNKNRGS